VLRATDTLGTIQTKKLLQWAGRKWQLVPQPQAQQPGLRMDQVTCLVQVVLSA
jgi:hypothetical protein